MVYAVDAGGGSSSVQPYTPPPPADPAVEARVAETAAFAQNAHGDPTYPIEQTMADNSLSQEQKDEFIARVVDLASGGEFDTMFGELNDDGRQELITALEEIGVAYTGSATPELREQVTDSMQRLVDDGRIGAEQIFALVDPSKNPASDGVRELLSEVTNGAVLQTVAHDLHAEARRGGIDLDSSEGMTDVAVLASAADLAGMAADHGYVYAANGITAYVADNPEILDIAQNMQLNAYGIPPEGRGGFDSFASALAGTSNTFANDKYDQVFSKMVDMAGSDRSAFDQSEGLNSLGDYFNRHIERLNTETTYAGSWNESAENATPPTAYHGLTERFVGNVMLNEDFDNAATQTAISDEMTRLGNIAGAPDGQYAPNEAERTEAVMQFGTLVGSMQGAANAYVDKTTADAEAQVEKLRTVTDLISGQALSKTGPLGEAFGGALIDNLWSRYTDGATQGAADDVDAALGDLNNLGEAIDQAITQTLRDTYPAATADETGVNGPGIVADYETTVDTHRTNPAE